MLSGLKTMTQIEFPNRKRSTKVAGRQTSFTLEDPFWDGLRAIAAGRGAPVCHVVTEIAGADVRGKSLSSAVRIAVLNHYRDRAEGRAQ